MELFSEAAVSAADIAFQPRESRAMAELYGTKGGNGGHEKNAGNAAYDKAADTAEDISQDLQSLQEDVTRLTQQIADIVAAKGTEVWRRARANVDGMIGEATGKGKEAADAVRDVGDTLADAIDESLERRPYTTLALALGLGFLFGAVWRR
jgi:ElaB/YqjD/DUF883 family membrane-anchored ribosome-binding protein